MTREEMEASILRNAVYELIDDHGLRVSVDLGGHDYALDRSDDPDEVLAAMAGAPEIILVAIKAGHPFGWAHFMRGHEGDVGHEIMWDLTVSLEPYLQETRALIQTYKEQAWDMPTAGAHKT